MCVCACRVGWCTLVLGGLVRSRVGALVRAPRWLVRARARRVRRRGGGLGRCEGGMVEVCIHVNGALPAGGGEGELGSKKQHWGDGGVMWAVIAGPY